MNTLFLTHPEADYGASFLFAGLCKVLGDTNVTDWPPKPSYHGETHRGYEVPEHNVFAANSCTSPLPWMPAFKDVLWDITDIEYGIEHRLYGVVVLESARPWVRREWAELGPAIKAAGIPVILHNGEDHPAIGQDFAREVEPDIYLVRERTRDMPFDERQGKTLIIPFPFSAPDCLVENAPPRPEVFDYEVSCLLGASHPNRKAVADALRESNLPGVYVAMSDPPEESLTRLPQHPLKSWPDYIDHLRRSRFGVSVRGYGWDTCRYWEVAAVTGLLADELDIHIPFPFESGLNSLEYAVYAESISFARWISNYNHFERAEEIARNGMAHCAKHHTNSARVRWMLEHLEGLPK